MKIINQYLVQEVLGNTLMIAVGLLAMFGFFDLIQELDNIGKGIK